MEVLDFHLFVFVRGRSVDLRNGHVQVLLPTVSWKTSTLTRYFGPRATTI